MRQVGDKSCAARKGPFAAQAPFVPVCAAAHKGADARKKGMDIFMKKALSLVLAAVMICLCFSACSTLKKDDKGAIVTMYLADQVYDYDPIVGFTDTAKAKILSLAFEGLTTLDEDGDWKRGMMKDYEYVKPEDEDGTYKLYIDLRDSKWSDGRPVQAEDFVYAWKRIVEPTTKCEAACLLYDVKNAYDIKMGDATVDNLGIYAVETYKLEIEFEHDVNLDEFFKTAASIALVPLRDDKVSTEPDWAKRASTMVTNGPFDIRAITYGQELSLERSSYYLRDTESNQALDKYVIPYRLKINYGQGNAAKQAQMFDEGAIFYLGEMAIKSRPYYEDKAEVVDSAITASYYINTENSLFEKAEVRRALSLAIDREALAELAVFAEPAGGLIPHKVNDAGGKGDFRKEGGEILASSADLDEAKSLLRSAGVSGGSFSISVRDNEFDVTLANEVAKAWKSLGFSVSVDRLGAKPIANTTAGQSVIYTDLYNEALASGDFDVIAVDYNMLSPNAFGALAPFAAEFSGNGVDMESSDYDIFTHVTGYNSDEYNELIASAYTEIDSSEKTKLLHDAETMLLEDMPVIPVLFLQDAYVTSNVISGVKNTYWGRDFKKMKMKNYMDYKESIQADERDDEIE